MTGLSGLPLSVRGDSRVDYIPEEETMTTERRTHTVGTADDGEMIVRYWSVYDQTWRTSVPEGIPDAELAAMAPEERNAILALRHADH